MTQVFLFDAFTEAAARELYELCTQQEDPLQESHAAQKANALSTLKTCAEEVIAAVARSSAALERNEARRVYDGIQSLIRLLDTS